MIEVENLSKRYGEVSAIRDVSFQARPGQVTGFLGPNGAGKTTTHAHPHRLHAAHVRPRHRRRP